MRAVLCTRYGPPEVLRLHDVPTPEPGRRDVRIRIRAAAVTSSDVLVRSAFESGPRATRLLLRLAAGWTRPRRTPGLVLAGEVDRAGTGVARFRSGDRVCAFTGLRFGAHAECTCLPETAAIAHAPPNLAWAQAAALPYGGMLAQHFLARGGLAPGQQVLIYGASGAVGTAAVQLARHAGAFVTAVCGPGHADLVRALGAAAVLDYTRQRTLDDRRYDLVLDAVGKRRTSPLKDAARAALAPGGRYVSVDSGRPAMRAPDLARVIALAEAGAWTPVVDRVFPLEDVAAAHRYVEQGHARGTVVLSLSAG